MGAAVSITRLDLTASELRKAASGEKDSAAARRILALALVLDGVDRKTAAETCASYNNHSKRMKEKRAVLDGVAAELRRIIGKPAETGLRLVA